MALVSQEVNINIVALDRASTVIQMVKNQLQGLKAEAAGTSGALNRLNTTSSQTRSTYSKLQRTFSGANRVFSESVSVVKSLGKAFIGLPITTVAKSFSYLSEQMLNTQRSFITLQYATEGYFRTITQGLTMIGSAAYGASALIQKPADAIALASTMMDTDLRKTERLVADVASRSGKSLEEVANALYMIGSSGTRNAEKAYKALRLTAYAAVAGGADMQQTFQTAIGMVNAFKKQGYTLADVYSKMFTAMKVGLLTFQDMSTYFGVITPAASQLGVSLDEALGGFTALTKMGLLPARAATATQMAFQDIFEKVDKLQKLGIQVYDERGKFVGILKLIKQLRDMTADLSDETKQAVLSSIGFEVRATRAIINWINNYETLEDTVQEIGRATGENASDIQSAYQKAASSVAMTFKKIQVIIQSTLYRLMPVFDRILLKVVPIVQKAADWAEEHLEGTFEALLGIAKATFRFMIPLKIIGSLAGDLFQVLYTMVHLINPLNLLLAGFGYAVYEYVENTKGGLEEIKKIVIGLYTVVKVKVYEFLGKIRNTVQQIGKGKNWVDVFNVIITQLAEWAAQFIKIVVEKIKRYMPDMWKGIKESLKTVGGATIDAVLKLKDIKGIPELKDNKWLLDKFKTALGAGLVAGVLTGSARAGVQIAALMWLFDVDKDKTVDWKGRIINVLGNVIAITTLTGTKYLGLKIGLALLADVFWGPGATGEGLKENLRKRIEGALGATLLFTPLPGGARGIAIPIALIFTGLSIGGLALSEYFKKNVFSKEAEGWLAGIWQRASEGKIQWLRDIAASIKEMVLNKSKNPIVAFFQDISILAQTTVLVILQTIVDAIQKVVDAFSKAADKVGEKIDALENKVKSFAENETVKGTARATWYTINPLILLWKLATNPEELKKEIHHEHQSGGYTANVGISQVAGVVHGGEWVAPAWMVKHPVWGKVIALLEQKRRGYKEGGLVGYGYGGHVPSVLDVGYGNAPDYAEDIRKNIKETKDTAQHIDDYIFKLWDTAKSITGILETSQKKITLPGLQWGSKTGVGIKEYGVGETYKPTWQIELIKQFGDQAMKLIDILWKDIESEQERLKLVEAIKAGKGAVDLSLLISTFKTASEKLSKDLSKALEKNISTPSIAPLTPIQTETMKLNEQYFNLVRETGNPTLLRYTVEQFKKMNEVVELLGKTTGESFDAVQLLTGDFENTKQRIITLTYAHEDLRKSYQAYLSEIAQARGLTYELTKEEAKRIELGWRYYDALSQMNIKSVEAARKLRDLFGEKGLGVITSNIEDYKTLSKVFEGMEKVVKGFKGAGEILAKSWGLDKIAGKVKDKFLEIWNKSALKTKYIPAAVSTGKNAAGWANEKLVQPFMSSGFFKTILQPIGAAISTALGGWAAGIMTILDALSPLLTELPMVQKLLNPFQTILEGIMEVLGPVINSALKPFVKLLEVFGRMLGVLILPILEPLLGGLQALAELLVWAYNTIIVPVGRNLYIVLGAAANAFNSFYNTVSDIVKKLTFDKVNLGHRATKSIDEIIKEANEKIGEIKISEEDFASEVQQTYTASVTRTGPETVNIYQYIQNSNFLNSEEELKRWVIEAVQEALDSGTLVIS